ncbi:hypothetical protein ACFY4B_27445 [Kitasatospora sp. NPDC001261]|uniref:hypothetical protein n=1 Tax=Kitasatospora sp. NPDC001261 TaxID=3364012 RepID=UPI00369D2238
MQAAHHAPDPYAQPAAHLHHCRRALERANTDMAGAFLHSAADTLRHIWPTAARLVFDRTENDRHPLRPVEFLRIEDRRGRAIATDADTAALTGDAQECWIIALHELLAAVRHLGAGTVPTGRPWRMESTYSFQREARAPYLLTITLPPAAPPPDSARLGDPAG